MITSNQIKSITFKKLPKYFCNFYKINLQNSYLGRSNHTLKTFTYNTPLVNTINNIYMFNTLIDYLLSSYILHKKNIQSKKASIIIAQIIDAGHFSKRTVYLSTTQSLFLKYKLKLSNYVNHYLPYPSLLNLKDVITPNKISLE